MNVPTSTQWITFPTKATDIVEVNWQEHLAPKQATYYVTKCFFGDLAKEDEDRVTPQKITTLPSNTVATSEAPKTLPLPVGCIVTKPMNVRGSAKLYIAKDLLDVQFSGGPFQSFHVLDIAKTTKKQQEAVKPLESASGWVTMQLNDCFQYGQNGRDLVRERWIVYHPRISMHMAFPNMFQHRFTNAGPPLVIKSASMDSLGGPDDLHSAAQNFANMEIQNSQGEALYTFLNPQQRVAAEAKVEQLQAMLKAEQKKFTGDKTTLKLAALQWQEALEAKQLDDSIDKGVRARLQEQADEHIRIMQREALFARFTETVSDFAVGLVTEQDSGDAISDLARGVHESFQLAADPVSLGIKRSASANPPDKNEIPPTLEVALTMDPNARDANLAPPAARGPLPKKSILNAPIDKLGRDIQLDAIQEHIRAKVAELTWRPPSSQGLPRVKENWSRPSRGNAMGKPDEPNPPLAGGDTGKAPARDFIARSSNPLIQVNQPKIVVVDRSRAKTNSQTQLPQINSGRKFL